MNEFQKCSFVYSMIAVIVILCVGNCEAALTIHKMLISPPKTEIPIGSGKVVLTVKASGGKNLIFQWKLNGPGKLKEPTTKSAVFYVPPDSIDRESEQVNITVTVGDDNEQEVTGDLSFIITKTSLLSPSPTPLEKVSPRRMASDEIHITGILLKDKQTNRIIEPISEIYHLNLNQLVTITVNVAKPRGHKVAFGWWKGERVSPVNDNTNLYTATKEGRDNVQICILDHTADTEVCQSITIEVH